MSRHDDAISQQLSEWANRLLQLDRRNNLLYFKPGRSAVRISDTTPARLENRLQRASRSGLTFDRIEPVAPSSDAFAHPETASEYPIKPGDISTDCDPADLQRRLRNLRRESRNWMEEQGVHVLFLAVGFLNWIDDDGEQARSPLLLLPCQLKQDSNRSPFRLVREDDEVSPNATLRHQLGLLGATLPEYAQGQSLTAYIEEVRMVAGAHPRWSVDSDIFLGAFRYSKLAMYEDLMRMSEQGAKNPLVRQLAGAVPAEVRSKGVSRHNPELAGGRLDDLLPLEKQFTVLPADFSQLQAIEDARRGDDMVIHGPPGTGKSQTITNLIFTLLAGRKRVLFVSEKTAALDVVKKWLEECDLGVFCLDLHSERGKKSEVYRQLKGSLDDPRQPQGRSLSIDDLRKSREELNRFVRLLHEQRLPLEKSVYEVHGLFADVHDAPLLEADVPPLSELTADYVRDAEQAAQRIASHPEGFRDHHSSRWRALRTDQPTLRLADLVRQDMRAVQSSVGELRSEAAFLCEWLGAPAIESAKDTQPLASLLGLLEQAPGVPGKWLNPDALAELKPLSQERARAQQERHRLEHVLSGWLDTPPLQFDYRAIARALRLSPDEQEAVAETAGAGWASALGSDPMRLLRQAVELSTALDQLQTNAEEVSAAIGGPAVRTLGQIDHALGIAPRLLGLKPVPAHWLNTSRLEDLVSEATGWSTRLKTFMNDEERLSKDFSDGLVERVDEEMLVRYRTDHQSFLRVFRGAYRRDQRILRGHLRSPRKLSIEEQRAAVELALTVKGQQECWRANEPQLRELFGGRFRGKETHWEQIHATLSVVKDLLAEWRGGSAELHSLLAVEPDGAHRVALESHIHPLKDAVARYRRAADAIGHQPLMAASLDIPNTAEIARRALKVLQRIYDATAGIYPILLTPPASYEQLTQFIGNGVALMAATEEEAHLAPSLAKDFGDFFKHESTDWDAVDDALAWTDTFLNAPIGLIGGALADHATSPQASQEYRTRADSLLKALDNFSQACNALDERFDIAMAGWDAWDAATLSDLEAWSEDLQAHAGSASEWVAYRNATHDFEARFGAEATGELRKLTNKAEDTPEIVRRLIYGRWLDATYKATPALQQFRRADHERTREQFQRLDNHFSDAALKRVRDIVFGGYPNSGDTTTPTKQLAEQLRILRHELSKRRQHMPVRTLMSRIPTLVQALKPCFLMSPLAVSQYLPAEQSDSDNLDFDVVIFDEASQIYPEEAIPAIERARQAIVVGDRMQLPPTSFFRGSHDDDGQDDDNDNFAGRESILDAMVGQAGDGLTERYLSTHYRSRSESLIHFSNHTFYEGRLLTFPSPYPADTDVATRDEYLPDATYDAGGSRTNRGEAERVVDLVFERMNTAPHDESVGVVALSRPQADLIEDLIEERQVLMPHLDERFAEGRHERFFVKNLENVQGDERDHIILSIGYGPTPRGDVPNRFGPINNEHGERRLNVAVTRARKSMTVVHSLRAEDIRSDKQGARELRRYLEYIRNPKPALTPGTPDIGQPGSKFEEVVLAALRSRGHDVDARIGGSGYQIDLAIKPAGGKAYDLGIMCDGPTYYSSPAARDREWLRESVLEGLGWNIHHVWSTAWVKDPDAEIRAIEGALWAALGVV